MLQTIQTANVLLVDDQESNIQLLTSILNAAGYTKLVSTTDARQAVPLFGQIRPDLILLDLMMPYVDGFQVMEQIRALTPDRAYLPILVLTADITKEAKHRALTLGAKDFLTKPFDPVEVLLRIRNLLETRFLHLQFQEQNRVLEERVRERTSELEQAQEEILERLALATEYRDDDTGEHTRRVGHLSALLARAFGLPEQQAELLRRAAPLHDVGKIGIPDNTLLKHGPLTQAEFEIMKTHSTIGARILSGGHSPLSRLAEEIALTHHERWDGSGYPQGLKGEDIPLAGRIVALADTFDALTHERPYKTAWPLEQALAEIARQRGRQFDPQLVDVLLRLTGGGCLVACTRGSPQAARRSPQRL